MSKHLLKTDNVILIVYVIMGRFNRIEGLGPALYKVILLTFEKLYTDIKAYLTINSQNLQSVSLSVFENVMSLICTA